MSTIQSKLQSTTTAKKMLCLNMHGFRSFTLNDQLKNPYLQDCTLLKMFIKLLKEVMPKKRVNKNERLFLFILYE